MVINKFPNREVYEKIKAKGSLGANDVNVLENYPGLEWKGEYSSTATYVKGDIVYYENMLYVMVSASVIGAIPGIDNDWIDFAKRSVTSSDVTNALGFTPADSTKVLPLSGGTLTGNLTGKYIIGTWLQATDAGHLATTPTKIPVFDDKGWIYYRTPAEILKDIGASSGYTLTEADKTEIAGKVVADGTEFTLSDFPTALKNPQKLKFTGAVTGEYDGSAEKTIDIPSGGSADLPPVLGNFNAAMQDAAAGSIPVYAGDEAWAIEKLIKTYTGDADLIGYIPDTVWVAAYMAAQKELLKLLPDSAAADAGKLLQVGADGNAAWGDKLPTALKNPAALTFAGAVTGTYDGSAALTVNIPAGGASGSGGALKAMSAVGGYIGIPAAELPENGVVWMCFGSGDSTELYTGTVTIQDAGIAVNDMLVITNGTVNPLNQVSWVSDGLAVYGLSPNDYRGVYQVVGAGGDSGTDLSLGVTGATVGQIAKISAVDANGVPTAWEPVDMPSGGGEKTLSLIASYDFTDNTASVFEETGLADLTELIFLPINVTNASTTPSGLTLKINNIDVVSALVPSGKKGTNTGSVGEPWEVCRYNGVFWECLLCNNKNGASGASVAASGAILNNHAIRNVGPATKIKLYVPNPLYKPVTGTLEVWGR